VDWSRLRGLEIILDIDPSSDGLGRLIRELGGPPERPYSEVFESPNRRDGKQSEASAYLTNCLPSLWHASWLPQGEAVNLIMIADIFIVSVFSLLAAGCRALRCLQGKNMDLYKKRHEFLLHHSFLSRGNQKERPLSGVQNRSCDDIEKNTKKYPTFFRLGTGVMLGVLAACA